MIYNPIKIKVEDIASSLGMPEMPDIDGLENATKELEQKYKGLPEESLRSMSLALRSRAFDEHYTEIRKKLLHKVKDRELHAYLEDGYFRFYPRTSWTRTAARFLQRPEPTGYRRKDCMKIVVEDFLRTGLSHLNEAPAKGFVKDRTRKRRKNIEPKKVSGTDLGSEK